MAIRTIPIRRAGNRTNLVLGGDRELVMFSGVLAGALVFSAHEIKAAVFGTLMWFGGLYVLRLMAKSDPAMRFVYLRQRRYKSYYAPRSTPFRNNGPAEEKQYR
ncbi:conjugal transfer protein TrbD [Luteibacter aegosomaticola]|uniref:conjugal transfer protein TrbD n=1 Tax=Luteibacter aegosomaticola TaxID=2911538 RepID=UPI001FF8572A|nr:conjugal transfer protein TrbD [Luteibacter aegosomaticola]UPG90351.1 conjugal transfer protein TrbD [Luteibacter aegosomaticola]